MFAQQTTCSHFDKSQIAAYSKSKLKITQNKIRRFRWYVVLISLLFEVSSCSTKKVQKITGIDQSNGYGPTYVSLPGAFIDIVKSNGKSNQVLLVSDTSSYILKSMSVSELQSFGQPDKYHANDYMVISENSEKHSTKHLTLSTLTNDPRKLIDGNSWSPIQSNKIADYKYSSDLIEFVSDSSLLVYQFNRKKSDHYYYYPNKSQNCLHFELPTRPLIYEPLFKESQYTKGVDRFYVPYLRPVFLAGKVDSSYLSGFDPNNNSPLDKIILTDSQKTTIKNLLVNYPMTGPLYELDRNNRTRYIGDLGRSTSNSKQGLLFLETNFYNELISIYSAEMPRNFGVFMRSPLDKTKAHCMREVNISEFQLKTTGEIVLLGLWDSSGIWTPSVEDLVPVITSINTSGVTDSIHLNAGIHTKHVREALLDHRFESLIDKDGNFYELYCPNRFWLNGENRNWYLHFLPFQQILDEFKPGDSLSLFQKGIPPQNLIKPIQTDSDYLRFEILKCDADGHSLQSIPFHSINGLLPKSWSITKDGRIALAASIVVHPACFPHKEFPYMSSPDEINGGFSTVIISDFDNLGVLNSIAKFDSIQFEFLAVDTSSHVYHYSLQGPKKEHIRNISVSVYSPGKDSHLHGLSPDFNLSAIIIEGFVCLYEPETGNLQFNGVSQKILEDRSEINAVRESLSKFFEIHYGLNAIPKI